MFNFKKKKKEKKSDDNIGLPSINPNILFLDSQFKETCIARDAYVIFEPIKSKPKSPSKKVSYYRGEEFDLGDFAVFSINLENLADIVFSHTDEVTQLVKVDLGIVGYIKVELLNSKLLDLDEREAVSEEIYERALESEEYLKLQFNYGVIKRSYDF